MEGCGPDVSKDHILLDQECADLLYGLKFQYWRLRHMSWLHLTEAHTYRLGSEAIETSLAHEGCH
jgi:hypothetical protein